MVRKNARTISPEDSARIARLKLMDDDFMTTCFNEHIRKEQVIIRV